MQSNKRIGVLSFDFFPPEGGQGKHVYDIYYEGLLKKNNFDVIFISPSKNDFNENRTYFHFVKKFGKHILFSCFMNLTIRSIIKRQKINILNIHSGPGGLFLLKKPRVDVVVTAHHTYYQQVKYLKNEWWKKVFIPLEKRTYQLADKIICVSESTKEILVSKYDIDPKLVTIIPNCVNLKKFKPIKGRTKQKNSLLFIGRLDERKGIRWLIKSFNKVVELNPNYNLYIGGKGKLKKWIENYILNKGLQKNIKLLGYVSEDNINNWYNSCEMAVIPSIFEGFGITAIEALATETPIIVRDTAGLKEIVHKDKNGFVINNSEDLIELLIKNKKRRFTKMRESVKKFSQENVIKKTAHHYNSKL